MQRMKALGLNCVTMYVAWNFHEEEEGTIHGLGNITGFLAAAKTAGMLVILRPGQTITHYKPKWRKQYLDLRCVLAIFIGSQHFGAGGPNQNTSRIQIL